MRGQLLGALLRLHSVGLRLTSLPLVFGGVDQSIGYYPGLSLWTLVSLYSVLAFLVPSKWWDQSKNHSLCTTAFKW